ncbi:hypothetical protein NEF87_004342 [Candidatus Lokiarchaeum ossiferum]|uniref:Flagellin modification protein A n=1 Tax=Candidatus Lokiarchaeum ossiferum TaxID=2951803 RepID=A0ABY6HYX1_9ARCH|nr:hypothetical protein NEF87_004342 [Candidatus Lokiarchaeum sp. B-35]
MENNFLENKVVVIAGALGRIGKAFVELVIESSGVPILADIDIDNSKSYLKSLEDRFNKQFDFISLDITSKKSLNSMIQKINSNYGRIDAFVNTTYPQVSGSTVVFEDVSYENFCKNLNLHLGGYFLASQQFAIFFKKQSYGNIINISSIQGVVAPKFDTYDGILINGNVMGCEPEYPAIKAGIIMLTKYMAKYFKNSNIRFNSISPGGILESQPEKFLKKYNSYCSSKGMLDSEDLKGALLFLLSDMSKYVNGQNIVVDDGWTL